eukprot:4467448-Amphidinium_carterae.1
MNSTQILSNTTEYTEAHHYARLLRSSLVGSSDATLYALSLVTVDLVLTIPMPSNQRDPQ